MHLNTVAVLLMCVTTRYKISLDITSQRLSDLPPHCHRALLPITLMRHYYILSGILIGGKG